MKKEKMTKRIFRFEGLDKYGYDSLLANVVAYPRAKGEQVVVIRRRKMSPRMVEVSIRSNLVFMVVLDITDEAGNYAMYENVDGAWKTVEEN